MTRADQILPWIQGPSVLDVGCVGSVAVTGYPDWLHRRLHEKGWKVTGLELSSAAVERARALGYDRINVGNAEDFTLADRFDTIVAGELLEHLANPGRFFDRCREHLLPGGRVVLTTPYAFGLASVLYAGLKFPKTCSNGEHVIWFCPATLRALGERAGFTVQHWALITDYPAAPGAWGLMTRSFAALDRVLPSRFTRNGLLFVFTQD